MASFILVAMYSAASAAIVVLGLADLISDRMPQLLKDLLLYGKAKGRSSSKTVARLIEVPKRWFLHFYVIGFVCSGFALASAVASYYSGIRAPVWLQSVVHELRSSNGGGALITTEVLPAVTVLAMMFFQHCRRLYECTVVSVYSPKATMNVIHYALGWMLYTTFPLCVFVEAHPLDGKFFLSAVSREAASCSWTVPVGVVMFLWASYYHHEAHVTLANLRLNKGQVGTFDHRIPSGGWFDIVSCPHYLMEIVIYFSFALVAGFNNWTLILGPVTFTIANQIVAGLVTHRWYRSTFKSYPSYRKAVIPFLL